jgi:hypothetical protein
VFFFISVFKHGDFLQDEDFVIDKDDGGSPTDDSGMEESDASESGGEKEANHFLTSVSFAQSYTRIIILFSSVTLFWELSFLFSL